MKRGRIVLWLTLFIIIGGAAFGMVMMTRNTDGDVNWKTHDEEQQTETEKTVRSFEETDTEQTEEETQVRGEVPRPEIDEQILTKNKYSRPGTKTSGIEYLVIHYLGNPKTTAQENRDYFESLKDLKDVSMSSNYIIGLDGEIIQCVPDDEIAYASNSLNKKSISIENCNIDSTGRFLKETYISLIKLTAYLAEKYDLDREHIIRHHDVTGKECPLYYVDNEEAWEIFLDDVMFYMKLCHMNAGEIQDMETYLDGLQFTYSSQFDPDIILEEKEDEKAESGTGRPHDFEGASDNSGEVEPQNTEEVSSRSENPEENFKDDYHDEEAVAPSDEHDYSDEQYPDEPYYNDSYSPSDDYNSTDYPLTDSEDIGEASMPTPGYTSDAGAADYSADDSSQDTGSVDNSNYEADAGVSPGSNDAGQDYSSGGIGADYVDGDDAGVGIVVGEEAFDNGNVVIEE